MQINKQNYINLVLSIIFGIAIGLWSAFSAGTLVVSLIFISILLYLNKILPKDLRKYVILMSFIAFLLRIIFASVYYYSFIHVGKTPIFSQDGEQYSARALYTSLLLKGDNPDEFNNSKIFGLDIPNFMNIYKGQMPKITDYQVGPYTYFVSVIYAFFGYSPLTIRWLNCLFGILTALLVFYIAKGVFNMKVAKATFFLTLFLPSLFLHSASALKDSSYNFFFMILVFIFMRWANYGLKKKYIVIALFSLFCLNALRHKSSLVVTAIVILLSYIILIRNRKTRKIIFCINIFLLLFIIFNMQKISGFFSTIKENAIRTHIGYVTTPGEVYKLLDTRYYNDLRLIRQINGAQLISYISKGLFRSFFEPFPWRYFSGVKIIYFIQMSIWFILSPFFLLGLLSSIKGNLSRIYPLLIFFFMFWFSLAITMANPGTVFRFRDSIAPLFLMISMAGFINKDN